MADPLGLIGSQGGARGISGPGSGAFRAGGAAKDQDGSSFKDVLLKNIEEVNKLQGEATQAQEDLVSGKRNDIENVLTATQKADAAFRMLMAVRNKVQGAYDEIKQVRI
jgi:flagellar hook-basal body complex protein FliE